MKTNHTVSGKIFRTAAAALILGGLVSAGGAFAGELSTVPSETIKFSELNLDSPAGIAALYSRIHAAALRVCTAGSRDLSQLASEKNCAIDAEARAVKQLNVGGLTAYFQAKTGRPMPTLAANTPSK
jgi:UrcA family protein